MEKKVLKARLELLCILISILLIWSNIDTIILFPALFSKPISPTVFLFPKEEEEAVQKILPKPVVITNGNRAYKRIALTFDADMTENMLALMKKGYVASWYNKKVTEVLIKENTKATIFLSGLWVKTYPKEAREIARNPLFEIANHSYSHLAFATPCYGLPKLQKENIQKDISESQAIITETTGITPEYFRFPGGCYDSKDLKTISDMGLQTVHWDVVSHDAFNKNSAIISESIESSAKNGSIIVLHIHGGPNAPATHLALSDVLPKLKKKGFSFVKISELLQTKKQKKEDYSEFLKTYLKRPSPVISTSNSLLHLKP